MVTKHGMNWYTPSKINHAKFERPPLNSVCEKANDKVFVKSEHVNYFP